MVQLLILYFFSLKATHGYEIQKFIQLNHMDEWNNIQSGSLYYAIRKLERDGHICFVEKFGEGEKKKQIYKITEKGREMLHILALEEARKPLQSISCEKFLFYPIAASLTKNELVECITSQQSKLQQKMNNINQWYKEKESSGCAMEFVTLEYMKTSIENQLKWHQALLTHIDETIMAAQKISALIQKIDYMTYTP
ncbi:PadR family transcriptional regulator [Anaerosacchariphilus polymeriproducens]|uniref:PadR family transcriptional regulator n=1 Tax=Anaerosacchariphilus polymeriproducens TaxID=1812858 RepID=A0A371AVV0_9FIRM|nr:PadR family transcriptional regulator [Anaerosacchariphilus polymeriproducens]RDU23659.1 PadR family transcriptional regulator [Anaerosacchariphilus polymeriproducens]